MYNIVFLVNKKYYNTKMSRVRFHSIRALFNHKQVNGIYTGPGWDNWVPTISPQANLDNILKSKEYDLVIGYKPLEISGFQDITYNKCIRYNEMYDTEWTLKEIAESKANVIICHHYNDYKEYINILKTKKLNHIKCITWVPHSADANIFKPKLEIEKKYDIALVGATNVTTMLGEHYPLRARMGKLLGLMPVQYKCAVVPHVGGSHSDAYTDKYAIDFANKINSAKIIITDSGAPKSRFGKYIEVPMCGVALAGDVYNDHPKDVDLLKSFLIDINMQMSDQEIIKKLVYYLENDSEREKKVKAGIQYTKDFTQERYAERFINILTSLQSQKDKYIKYVNLQKEKTTDPIRREKWLNNEWSSKLEGFKNVFNKHINYIGHRCLCIGARTGQEVQALKDLNKDAIGIDLVGCPPLVIEGDFHNLSFNDNSFDFIFSNALDHSLYPSKFCSEMIRVLKPGGTVLLHLQVDVPNDKYGVFDIKNIQTDVYNRLPSNIEIIKSTNISYKEFHTLNREVLIKI